MRNVTVLMVVFLMGTWPLLSQVNNPWEVPDEYKKMENPFEADKSSLSIGASFYENHCQTCHGKAGEGDGLTAKTLEVSPSDLTLDDLDTQTDGEIYYKILIGREEMPCYNNKIEKDDVWHIVNYIRTFYKEK